jgi:hypothetical protein
LLEIKGYEVFRVDSCPSGPQRFHCCHPAPAALRLSVLFSVSIFALLTRQSVSQSQKKSHGPVRANTGPQGIVEWLVGRLSEETLTLVGIDHGFSFPLQYFEQHRFPLDWPSFLDDFQRHWPTDQKLRQLVQTRKHKASSSLVN